LVVLGKMGKIDEGARMSVREEIMSLKPLEKIHLVDELLLSLDTPSNVLDSIWLEEIEARVKAYDNGKVIAKDASKVLSKYTK